MVRERTPPDASSSAGSCRVAACTTCRTCIVPNAPRPSILNQCRADTFHRTVTRCAQLEQQTLRGTGDMRHACEYASPRAAAARQSCSHVLSPCDSSMQRFCSEMMSCATALRSTFGCASSIETPSRSCNSCAALSKERKIGVVSHSVLEQAWRLQY